jgi:hypothetical protein
MHPLLATASNYGRIGKGYLLEREEDENKHENASKIFKAVAKKKSHVAR